MCACVYEWFVVRVCFDWPGNRGRRAALWICWLWDACCILIGSAKGSVQSDRSTVVWNEAVRSIGWPLHCVACVSSCVM